MQRVLDVVPIVKGGIQYWLLRCFPDIQSPESCEQLLKTRTVVKEGKMGKILALRIPQFSRCPSLPKFLKCFECFCIGNDIKV